MLNFFNCSTALNAMNNGMPKHFSFTLLNLVFYDTNCKDIHKDRISSNAKHVKDTMRQI